MGRGCLRKSLRLTASLFHDDDGVGSCAHDDSPSEPTRSIGMQSDVIMKSLREQIQGSKGPGAECSGDCETMSAGVRTGKGIPMLSTFVRLNSLGTAIEN